MKKIIYLTLLLSICFGYNAQSQDSSPVTRAALTALKTLSGDRIIEKAYLHFDKPYYATGDTIYFKAYVMLGEQHDLSRASSVLNVDLIDPKNTILATVKLQLNNGVGWGDFSLPDGLLKGNYRVRAYTRYMLNDKNYIFDQVIPVGSISSGAVSESAASTAQSGKPDLQFFPEGGELVTSLLSKVAFKAVNTSGMGINAKGVILDQANNQVTTFASTHLGMGTFNLQPEEGKSYKAKVTFEDGTKDTFDIPTSVSRGVVLAVKDTLGKISIEIRCNRLYLQENMNKDISLVIYCNGFVNTVNTKLDSRLLGIDIPNSQFPSGVLQVTLFSQNGDPLSERLLFLRNPDLINLAVNSDKTSYSKREKVSININAKDKGANAMGHFSVSVIDETKVPLDENKENTILSNLLLTSELMGYVEQPNYYFAHNDDNALDALMLTQGYRRFAWKSLLSNSEPKFAYAPAKGFEIKGTEKMPYGEAVSKKDVILRAPSSKILLTQQTDEEGRFKFDSLAFMDQTLFTVNTAGSAKSKNAPVLTVIKEAPLAVDNLSTPFIDADVNQPTTAYLDNNKQQKDYWFKYGPKNSIPLKGVKVNEYRVTPNMVASVSGSNNADQVVTSEALQGFPSLSQALQGRLRGITFSNGIPSVNSSMTGGGMGMGNKAMLIVVDGSIVGSRLDDINPRDVERVEVLKGGNAAIYGVNGAGGVLIITSKQGRNSERIETKGIGNLEFMPQGFYRAREFYTPKYAGKAPKNDHADLRSTIAWVPELITDNNGNASFEYNNADGTGSYRLVIEGIDDKGNIGRQVYRYNVE
jgi:TonB-dependent SusC/RagA subfamily outer membrane receptor